MTVITDDFNRANNASMGANWTEVTAGWSIASNRASAQSGAISLMRHNSSLATDNHYAQAVVTSMTISDSGVVVRYNNGATAALSTFYLGRYGTTSGQWQILKCIAGAFTVLATLTEAAPGVPYTIKLEVNGSTLNLYNGATLKVTTTDTDITGNLQVGARASLGTAFIIDDFEAGDLTTTVNSGFFALL